MEEEKEEQAPATPLPTGDEKSPPPADLEEQLRQREQEAKDYYDKYLRACAELENYKKMVIKEKVELLRYGQEALLKDLLPAVDSLEKALVYAKTSQGMEEFLAGMDLIHKQLMEVLTRAGVTPIPSGGRPFDPTLHQAVAGVESDTAEENMVIEELQKGYMFHEKVLRPSMVSVAKKSKEGDH